MTRMCPILEPDSLRMFLLLFFRARNLEKSLFSKSPAYTSHKHASDYSTLSSSAYLDNKLRSGMELEPKTLDSAKAVLNGL